MTENISENPNNKLTCESCGKEFFCGAETGKCWCFEVDLAKESLAKLREDFKNCLCEDCLRSNEKTYI